MQGTTRDDPIRLSAHPSVSTEAEAHEEFVDLEIEELEPRIAYFYSGPFSYTGSGGGGCGCSCDCCSQCCPH